MPHQPPSLPRSAAPRAAALRRICLAGAALCAAAALAQPVDPGTAADIEERTRPHGKLCLVGDACGGEPAPPPVAAAGRGGGDIYGQFCRACHEAGVAGAPKLGDAEAWAPRLDKGADALLASTRQGMGAMPPMGLCMDCSDAELQAAIDYLAGAAQ